MIKSRIDYPCSAAHGSVRFDLQSLNHLAKKIVYISHNNSLSDTASIIWSGRIRVSSIRGWVYSIQIDWFAGIFSRETDEDRFDRRNVITCHISTSPRDGRRWVRGVLFNYVRYRHDYNEISLIPDVRDIWYLSWKESFCVSYLQNYLRCEVEKPRWCAYVYQDSYR